MVDDELNSLRTMAATAKKIGQAGLAQLGRLARRSKHGGESSASESSQSLYKNVAMAEESSVSAASGSVFEQLYPDNGSDLTSNSPILKSSSMCNITSDASEMDQPDIQDLTQQVKAFSDALSSLKDLFLPRGQEIKQSDLSISAHTRLGEVVTILKTVLTDYQSLNSTDVFISASQLIAKIKNLDEGDDLTASEDDLQSVCTIVDSLALAFSTSVSEYLMGDNEIVTIHPARTKSYDDSDLPHKDCSSTSPQPSSTYRSALRLSRNVDDILKQMDVGVDIALQRAKSWAKYAKDIITYVERKAHYEMEYCKNLVRLSNSMKPVISEEGFLPLQDEYFLSLDYDFNFASSLQASASAILSQKFIEPLTARRNDHEKTRKSIKDMWNKEVKRMEQAVNSLKNAKSMYVQRRQEYERACELSQKAESEMLGVSGGTASSKVDKRKKAVEDAVHKAAEAETTYKACVAEANMRQVEIASVKSSVLSRLHEQIMLGDTVLKKVTRDYFNLQCTASSDLPKQYQDLYDKCELYDAGNEYAQFVSHLTPSVLSPVFSQPFLFEPYTSDRAADRKTSNQSSGSLSSVPQSFNNSPQTTKGTHRTLVRAWSHSMGSDSESASGSSNKSIDSSPSASPHADVKVHGRRSMGDLAEEDVLNDSANAKSKKESSDFVGICKRLGNRRGTFGVDFSEQVLSFQTMVPPIVSKCLLEIELRGLDMEGIYRKSAVKSKMEILCQKFENSRGKLDISDENPIVISNVLKLYLRQLPEPLMTFALYPEFIQIARDDMSGNVTTDTSLDKLTDLVTRLPHSNKHTCAVLMHHLHRVTLHKDENHMSEHNLGIVFGPTLFRPSEGANSLTALVDTPHQTHAIELLISNPQKVFGEASSFSLTSESTEVSKAQTLQTTTYTATLGEPLADTSGVPHLPLRRSSSTPISESSLADLAKVYETSQTHIQEKNTESDEMRDMVMRRQPDVHRLRSSVRTMSADEKPEDTKTRLAKSLEIKAKFLLGAEGDLQTGSNNDSTSTLVIDTKPADTTLVSNSGDTPTESIKPSRFSSSSLSEARAKFLLGSPTNVDDEKIDFKPTSPLVSKKRIQSQSGSAKASPVLSAKDTHFTTDIHVFVEQPQTTRDKIEQKDSQLNSVKTKAPKQIYHESEACESSIPSSKCVLTVPSPYPRLTSSPTPAPKLRLPAGAVTPTHSPVPSRSLYSRSDISHSPSPARDSLTARNGQSNTVFSHPDLSKYSDDDISYV